MISCGEEEPVTISKITFNLNPMVDFSKHPSVNMLKKKPFIGQNYVLTLKNPVTGEDKIIKGSWGVPVNVTLEAGYYAVVGGSIGKNVSNTNFCRIQTEASFEILYNIIEVTSDNCSFDLNGLLDCSMIVIPKDSEANRAETYYKHENDFYPQKYGQRFDFTKFPETDKYVYAFVRDVPDAVPDGYRSILEVGASSIYRTFDMENIYCKGGLYLYSSSSRSFSNFSIDAYQPAQFCAR